MKKISNHILFILLFFLAVGCAGKNISNNSNNSNVNNAVNTVERITKEINIIKPPAWIDEKQYSNKIFYSIGKSDGNNNIKYVLELAKNNAIEKIKQAIEKHINNIYNRNTSYIANKDKKDSYLSMITPAIFGVINNKDLKKYITMENNWTNIDDLNMHVLMYIEPSIVKTILTNELKEIYKKYSYDEAFVIFLEQLQQDIEKNFSLVIENIEKSIITNNQNIDNGNEPSTVDDSSIGAKIDEIELKEKQRNDIITKTIIYAKKSNIGK